MKKKDYATLQAIRENMLVALQAAKEERKLTDNQQEKEYWNGQIVAYRDILRQLHYFPSSAEFLTDELLEIYNSWIKKRIELQWVKKIGEYNGN